MNKSIGIIEYGVGNLKSLENTFRHINNQVIRVKEDDDFDKIDYLVLPGVELSNCMEKLNSSKLIPQIYNWLIKTNHFQVYVGMQMLFDSSEEFGEKRDQVLLMEK